MQHRVGVVADALGNEIDRVVLAGAAAAAFFDLSPALLGLRPTKDVDLVVEAITVADYHALIDRLRRQGSLRDPSMAESSPLCRYILNDVLVDLMPIQEEVLGFGNPWFKEAARDSLCVATPRGTEIRVITPTHFVATKIAAFVDRGKDDLLGSHDLEDILTVLAAGEGLVEEIRLGNADVHAWIRARFRELLDEPHCGAALVGHVEAGMLPPFDARAFVERIRAMCRG